MLKIRALGIKYKKKCLVWVTLPYLNNGMQTKSFPDKKPHIILVAQYKKQSMTKSSF